MKWERKDSGNFEDRRGMSGGGKALIGGGLIGIVVLLLNMFGGETGQTIGNIIQQTQGTETEPTQTRELSAEEKELGDFAESCFVYNNETWAKVFQENNMDFEEPGMVLFYDGVNTACGSATSASGPFYCPSDKKIYMDLRFFEELKTRFGAQGGDFAIAYVIAHEMGHHLQTILGTSGKVRQLQQGKSETEANKLSVGLELQADFYAGVWAHYNKNLLEEGDIEEALSAAHAVGDDAIQRKMQGHVTPDTFTHGTSEQRMYWFKKGYNSGDIKQGDTFSTIMD
ncbi:neutral zinc metallopeptidase [Flavobacterium sp. J49]|uniref:KPN_02809 family neutral zinc metallopeptidase n=1 Tax=Flavobacterium sp. J49 TaxID=2718534 RepID=UPI001593381B|nr:neutral zinc metallopeptidase [Flavobacterium sp. J49]MBF6642537.1 neutral zinc metallopeptidase [Flavobacterium sp. J49]NIC03783.1 metalloprotease [Flavobacterium sp. J49]